MKERKTVVLPDGSECLVETLREWLNGRISQLRRARRDSLDYVRDENLCGRLAELLIIRDKVNTKRIDEIG